MESLQAHLSTNQTQVRKKNALVIIIKLQLLVANFYSQEGNLLVNVSVSQSVNHSSKIDGMFTAAVFGV